MIFKKYFRIRRLKWQKDHKGFRNHFVFLLIIVIFGTLFSTFLGPVLFMFNFEKQSIIKIADISENSYHLIVSGNFFEFIIRHFGRNFILYSFGVFFAYTLDFIGFAAIHFRKSYKVSQKN